jgi:hypothetical protein
MKKRLSVGRVVIGIVVAVTALPIAFGIRLVAGILGEALEVLSNHRKLRAAARVSKSQGTIIDELAGGTVSEEEVRALIDSPFLGQDVKDLLAAKLREVTVRPATRPDRGPLM